MVIPAKRDKGGRRFGFARFNGVKDVRRFGIELDNIIIGRDKIFVNPPRFHRDTGLRRQQRHEESGEQHCRVSKNETQIRRSREPKVLQHKNPAGPSFAQVTQAHEPPKKKASILFVIEKQIVTNLQKAFVGVVKHSGMSYNIQEEFHMQGYFGVKATPLGANLVLLEDKEDGEIKALMEDACGWLEQWFKDIRPWSPREVDNDRLVWFRVYGIPAHAWNDEFFTMLSKPFGTFLNADDSTSKKLTMDVARLMLRTSGLKPVDELLNVKINDDWFQLRVIEDSYGPMRIVVPSKENKEGRDAADSSSEDEDGVFPAIAEAVEEEEREEEVGGKHLLALTNFVNTNESIPNGFGNVSRGSNGREDSMESSKNSINEENLNFSNSNARENLGEEFKEMVVVDCDESCDNNTPISPCQSSCHCNKRSNVKGGVKGSKGEQGGGMSNNSRGADILNGRPIPINSNGSGIGGKGGQVGGGINSGSQKIIIGSKSGPKTNVGKIGSVISATGGFPSKTNSSTRIQKTQTLPTYPSRAMGSSTNPTVRRAANQISFNSMPSSKSPTVKEGCLRNPIGNFKALKTKETSLSSAGSILYCSSLKSTEIRNCNKNFWNKHEAEVNGKLWERVKDLGVEGEEGDEVYVEQLRSNENKDKEARRMREQRNQGTFDICLLQETKRDNFDDFMIQNVWGHKDVEWVAKGSVGLSGGNLYIINVYSPCSLSGKRKLWSDLLEFKLNNEQGEWCLRGDFNVVLNVGERKGSTSSARQNERLEFCQFVEAMELIDVPVAGKKFSWFSADGNAISRLDRFLLSDNFIEKEEVAGQWIGNHDISDHCPIWLMCSNLNWGPKPFKVNNCWLEHSEFKLFVEKTWEKLNIRGKKAFVIKEKLKRLKEELRGWNREVFSILDLNIEKTVKELNEVEGLVGNDGVNSVMGDKSGVNRKFWEQLYFKESMIKQKSRLKWVREGDSNTRFFQASLKNRRRRNQLVLLRRGDDLIQGVDNIKMEVKNHFARNFTEEWHHRPFVNGINFNELSTEDNEFLLQPFSEERVREVIWSCDGNKSPGPDGFNFNFWKEFWSTLKFDVMEFLNEFYQNVVLPKAITASFLALIPKKDHPQQLSEYRLICLIGLLYKILSKLLAARLKHVMGKLISTCQSVFLPRRQILDGVVVLNEVIDLAKRRKDSCLFFKVDFERTYDTISWNYLEKMMIKMGFAERWMKWIRACIFNSSMSVLTNGSPMEDFTVGKGLRQGDPLSPFLFLIAAEGLTGMVNKAVEIGKYVDYKVNDSIRFQILQFADDTILMGDCSWDNVRTMKSILRGFELVSGLKINFVKSKLYGINVESSVLAAAATFLDCSYDSIPFKFLGIPVGANPRRKATWKPIVESMEKRLSSWNDRNLSIGGRLARIQRNFLWGGGAEDKKMCWVKWAQVCLPKEKGGLGVRDLEMFNLALLCKWKWRCINEKDALWYDLMRFRYGPLSVKLLSWEAVETGSKDSIWWRDVVGIGGKGADCWFPSHVSSVLGNGNTISFWKEKWNGAVPLRDLFPNLYEKVLFKNSVVSDLIQTSSYELNWNRDWLLSLSQDALVEKADLEQLLFGLVLHSNIED
ncbi:hypothetical protein TSUD_20950 [Trifolium subterraneum]|uniref:Reverse transcriptase domain-containing protein n=1 Tax=Trifolium subterraneum TaxID=3900 RepID=A0A2Z6N9A6_TRISU|nr:hypothetical protein TSUD_20950 [Trifolium subterraneum]